MIYPALKGKQKEAFIDLLLLFSWFALNHSRWKRERNSASSGMVSFWGESFVEWSKRTTSILFLIYSILLDLRNVTIIHTHKKVSGLDSSFYRLLSLKSKVNRKLLTLLLGHFNLFSDVLKVKILILSHTNPLRLFYWFIFKKVLVQKSYLPFIWP